MSSLFAFSPSDTAVKIRLAVSYTPHILQNHISVRPYNGLLYVVGGSYTYTYEGGSLTANSGDLIYLPARSIPYDYTVRAASENAQTLQIEFELQSISSEAVLSFSSHPILLTLPDSNSIRYAMKAAVSAHTKGTVASNFLAVSELFRILALCSEIGRGEENISAKKTIAPAISFLEEHYKEDVCSYDLATICHISESQLRRTFRVATGMSPMAYRRHLLHVNARNLLRVGEFKIGEVAELLGFPDIYAFSHFFAKAEGISPREFCRLFPSSQK